ncbi:DUF2855 family protein [Nonomuraea basaltis]|uniref:DUF2855 family protein n=1 Tax=Nonomuraea basaltis TaxID=2495887 RepID=UPI00110C7181|nr:DUF2855 family protein [Nonomuraea basaltis]TMR95230.1 DUF2855 family protein [Nonomuraea basaltis]
MWDLLTNRDDLRKTEVRPVPALEPADGEVLLEVERFALTSNNITYGKVGDSFGYWRFFPAPHGWGRLPCWGFARVVRSRAPGVAEGLRVYGYLPMSTHVTMRLAPTGDRAELPARAYADTAAHRAEGSATYNTYVAMPADPFDNHRVVWRSLFSTSYLLDHELSQAEPAQAAAPTTVVLSSASSKTAMGLAWLLRRRQVTVVGLTSTDKVAALTRHGLYDQLVSYDEIAGQNLQGPMAFVDFAGDPGVVGAVHQRFAHHLTRSIIVGVTHWDAAARGGDLPGPTPTLFFAPERVRSLTADVGGTELLQRMDTAMRDFIAACPWLRIVEHTGPEALQKIYNTVIDGHAKPEDIHIIKPA